MDKSTAEAILYWIPQSQLKVLMDMSLSFDPLEAGLLFIIGLFFGSFLNVVALRFENNKWISGGSACFNCKSPIKWHYNIPLVGAAIQLWKAQCCGAKIPVRYVFVEILTGLLFSLFSFLPIDWELLILLAIVGALIVSSLVDYETMTLPMSIHLIVYSLSFTYALLAYGISWTIGLNVILNSVFIFGIGWLFWIIMNKIFGKEPFGGGDLLFLISIYPTVSLGAIPSIILIATIISLILLLLKLKFPDNEMPFGPSLAAGWMFVFIINYGNEFSEITRDIIFKL